MELLILLLTLSPWIAVGTSDNTAPEPLGNSTDTNKDMYVIHAMVYQVGILTNKTDDEDTHANSIGNQEVLTLYHSNGSNIDLSNIPTPLLTNITAQRLVGVAPSLDVGNDSDDNSAAQWNTLNDLASLQAANAENPNETRHTRQVTPDTEDNENSNGDVDYDLDNRPTIMERLLKRSLIMKRDASKEVKTPIKVVEGSAVIPKEAGVQSIGIPSLLTLNNNLSEIPVPIPNTSVVHYSKINTLVHTL